MDQKQFEADVRSLYNDKPLYEQWVEAQKIPVIREFYLEDIPAGKSLKPQRLMYEEVLYVLEGSGSTAVWNDENKKVTFEWGPGSLFSPPLNTWRQHFNGSGEKPARLLGVTSAPPLMNLFRNLDFVFNNPFAFKSRFDP